MTISLCQMGPTHRPPVLMAGSMAWLPEEDLWVQVSAEKSGHLLPPSLSQEKRDKKGS